MKFRLWMLALGLFMCVPGFAQEGEIDLANLTANRKTFVFNDSKHTVKKYINTQLQKETSCCGENDDRIYLEVRIDPTGYVVSAKAITGKNECFKQSAEDLVKRVKWEANDSRGPKSIYIELRPKVECVAGKDNNYAQLKIFNNKLMDENGNRVEMSTGSQEKTDRLVEMVTGTKKQPESVPAEQAAETKTPAKEIADNTKEEVKTVTEEVKTAPAEAKEKADIASKEVETKVAEATPMASTADKVAADPIEEVLTEEEKAARAKEEAERAVQEEEINQLRKQMAELRAKKMQTDSIQAAKEKARAARQAKRQAYLAKKREAAERAKAEDATWTDEGNENKSGEAWTEGEEGTGSMSEAERLREEIKRLQDQEREIEIARQQREDEVRRQMDENDRSNQEMIQLAEERLRIEEQLYQVEEQEELDIIEKDRQQVEDTRREQENEYQRIMDEVNRLQQEAQLKIQDLERQKSDLDILAARKQAREQEIMLARATRELEREAQLERIRLDMMNNSMASSQATPRGLSSTIDNEALLNDILPDLTTKADSEKLVLLIQQIQQMKAELVMLRSQIATMDRSVAGTPSTTSVPGSAQPTVGATRSATDPNVKSAANDDSWKNLDIAAPGVSIDKYIVNRSNTPPPPSAGPRPSGGTSPDPSNPDTHDNMEGPKFSPRFYIDGEDAMKDLVKDRLRLGGVCGLAHTVFSVTLDPQGSVAAFSVLTSNNAIVQMQMNSIIPTLKFNAIDQRFNQTIYQEIKAEILCNGAEDKVNLKEVKDLIKKNQ